MKKSLVLLLVVIISGCKQKNKAPKETDHNSPTATIIFLCFGRFTGSFLRPWVPGAPWPLSEHNLYSHPRIFDTK